jgi:ABC-2 type transport system ATP-binding protein
MASGRARTAAAAFPRPARPGGPRSTAAKTAASTAAAARAAAARAAAARAAQQRAAAQADALAAEVAAAGEASREPVAAAAVADIAGATEAAGAYESKSDAETFIIKSAPAAPAGLESRALLAVQDVPLESFSVTPRAASPRPRGKAGAVVARALREVRDPLAPVVVHASGLVRRFGSTTAVSGIDLDVRAGSLYGIVGPNGAGKTTTLSMITGLLRPTEGSIHVQGIDIWAKPAQAKRLIGVLPDRLRLFDRLTGAQLLYYSGTLRGLDHRTVRDRSADLAAAFGLEDALNRLVADYSVGMTKKIALACAMIHSPRVLVLDEPFESVDPVSAVNVTEILQNYVAGGGTVLLSSHGMDLIERVCDHVAIIVQGRVLASGAIADVRGAITLEERFVELAGGRPSAEGMEWLHSSSD